METTVPSPDFLKPGLSLVCTNTGDISRKWETILKKHGSMAGSQKVPFSWKTGEAMKANWS